jgi:hypothetical protein
MGEKRRGGEHWRTATPDFSDMSIALVCMVALGRWSGGGVALDLGPPDSRRGQSISSWRGASVDDERERGSWKEALC